MSTLKAINSLALILLVAACARNPAEMAIEEIRVSTVASRPAVVNATNELRFGRMPAPAPAPASRGRAPIAWEIPPGWTELAPTDIRIVNMRVGEGAECYLAFLAGSGGGLEGNVNRWRDQMGLSPFSTDEVLAMPKRKILGQDAVLVDLEGAYSGMSDDARPDFALLGAIFSIPTGTLFVKMTGPSDVVRTQRANFDLFCDSLAVNLPEDSQQHGPDDGHDHGPDDGHDHGGATPPPAGAGTQSGGGFTFDAPAGWTREDRAVRAVNFRLGASGESECYVTVLGGDGGGLEANLNRWQSQLGLTALTQAEIESLRRVVVLGAETPLFEGYGSFSGMGGTDRSSAGMLGTVSLLQGHSVFIKMVGPETEIRAERENFLRFAQSLRKL